MQLLRLIRQEVVVRGTVAEEVGQKTAKGVDENKIHQRFCRKRMRSIIGGDSWPQLQLCFSEIDVLREWGGGGIYGRR